MSEEGKKRGLGRGLDALLGDGTEDEDKVERVRATKTVPIEFIRPGRYQPRRNFDKEDLDALTRSVREKGVLQPVLVRRHAEDPTYYELIAGERRWLAAQSAQLHEIPVIIKELSDQEALEVALVENVQRADLSPLEEAEGYRRLMQEFHHTQEALAEVVGKSRSHVANALRLLGLPDEVKRMVDEGQLSASHARALLNAENAVEVARQVVGRNLNVRQTERLVNDSRGRVAARRPRRSGDGQSKSADTLALEQELTNRLGLKVEIRDHAGGGELVIRYQTLEQLDDVLHKLSSGGR